VLSKNIKIKFSITIILLVLWVQNTIREEHMLGVFENRELRNICGPNRDEEEGHGKNYIMKSFICAAHGGRREERCIQVFREEIRDKRPLGRPKCR
jgi:hypothetical protein